MIHRRAGFPAGNQIRVGEERPAHGEQIASSRGKIALGTCGIVTAGEELQYTTPSPSRLAINALTV